MVPRSETVGGTAFQPRRVVKAFVPVTIAALVVCASAAAKFSVSIGVGDVTPAVGQRVTFVVRSERPLDYNLRLIAVAPGQGVFRVVATITGDTAYPDPNVAGHGFEIRLVRIAPNRWRGAARFARRGLWRVVVPDVAPAGVIVPNGAALVNLAVH
jgi:hypothetical protein